ncbi:Ribulosamine/erythrulosamine 3-kinase potentially involved in protein deglycation [Lunatimonas lonarensis]|uniref:Ribulosamine/erythrulosamine 3-kinase potentially involved in protein deglycation n=1 Tax=Lunatimonas lonarensis TaxID=1232681 RepID=R7ZUH9_9BACT|nr:fructosamine kinase family protein [Lunatimonas lonarensis]EON77634.1 Ribulosamine/erythrulosamine 3-kinase potentially involved in protein deglycation [Lunatimonas lonarensis]
MENPSEDFESILFEVFGQEIDVPDFALVASGHANQAILLDTSRGAFLLKVSTVVESRQFGEEARGLKLIGRHTSLKVPEVYGYGKVGTSHYILMEWLVQGKRVPTYWSELGEGIAELHMATVSNFGFEVSNYIADLPQRNTYRPDWNTFFVEERLEPMLHRAYLHQLISKENLIKVQSIYPRFAGLFPNERPSLLHGDLWSGNVLSTEKGNPALIDPSVYYGHREMDLAFSKLFGGFDAAFYEAYNHVFPLDPGFDDRMDVYNLYPLLVHLNLFGAGYLPGVLRIVDRFS